MRRLLRRALCRLGRHDVIRCAGAADHAWTWTGGRWRARIVTPPAVTTPVVQVLEVGEDERGAYFRGRVLTPAEREARSAALLCRCGDRQDEHHPAALGGCRLCPCPGMALTPREELDLHRAHPPARHRHRRSS